MRGFALKHSAVESFSRQTPVPRQPFTRGCWAVDSIDAIREMSFVKYIRSEVYSWKFMDSQKGSTFQGVQVNKPGLIELYHILRTHLLGANQKVVKTAPARSVSETTPAVGLHQKRNLLELSCYMA